MKKIGLLSDTHSFLDSRIFEYFQDVDQVWHAGDVGSVKLLEELNSFKPTTAVWGNIDDKNIRSLIPETAFFSVESTNVCITHIAGYPGKFTSKAKSLIKQYNPDIFICGHSHILKIMNDPVNNLLFINPGACGNEGFHKIKTIMKFEINGKKIENMKVIELGKRGFNP